VGLGLLQCVAVYCSVLQCVLAHHKLYMAEGYARCVAVCCSVFQSVSVFFSVLQCVLADFTAEEWAQVCCSVLQFITACCNFLQCGEYVAVCADRLERLYGRRVGVWGGYR